MCSLMDDGWLENYYQKVIAEKQLDLDRRDRFTNWGLTIFIGILALYIDLLQKNVLSIWRMIILYVSFLFLIRFFIHSCLAYAWVYKWNDLTKTIEIYWLSDKKTSNLEKVVKKIKELDHENKVPIKRRMILWGQLRTGYMMIFILLLILMIVDLVYFNSSQECINIFFAIISIVYVLYEMDQFVKYEKINLPGKK